MSDDERTRLPIRRLAGIALCLLAATFAPGAGAAELRGHGGPVRALAITADGGTAVSGSFDTAVILWSLASGSARQVLRFHASQVNAVAALPDGRAASAGADGQIALWKPGEAAPERVLEGHTAPVAALAVSPDGATLASAAWDGTVRLWPLGGGAPRVLRGHDGNVNAVAFLADGTPASAGYDLTVRFWKPPDFAPETVTLPSPINTLVALGGDRLAAGSADGRVRLLDRTGRVLADAEVSPTPVIALAASPDGTMLAAAGLRGAIALLDGSTLATIRTLVGPGLPIWSAAFSPDGGTLLTGGADRVIRAWDVATGAHRGGIVAGGPADPLAAYEGDRGAEVFRACIACHTLDPAEGPRAGPTLHGIFGRRIASLPGYPYSHALEGMDIVWTPETVAKLFEVGPMRYTPGTKMPEQRIGSAEDRAALVAFLARAAMKKDQPDPSAGSPARK
ncbi:c-type cytochrome [Propylenella binzhouense]|uniref:C-type cytochrome n=1 Tax=Propylenella binzhouense TaxID=2555902 RepID=A0A964T811_9HYPH|nr:c-type cytochrome [Propylenella binzhouense]MYZ50261.1 c-type cytochrome [Propylenella binzhouense]